MLSFIDSSNRSSRRSFLQVGSLGLAGLTLDQLFRSQVAADSVQASTMKDKSVVFLFMHGGPSQIETFDPKMTAPSGIRSATGEVATKIPGVTFGGTFPKLASLADKLSIVRSFKTGTSAHDIKPLVGKDSANANIGSLYSKITGASNPATGVPNNVALFPQSIDKERQPGNFQFGNFAATGNLGSSFAPFMPGAGGSLQEDMKLKLGPTQLDDRRTLLQQLDRLNRNLDNSGSMQGVDKFRDQAFRTILGGVADAFDLSKEDAGTIARYDTAPLVTPDQISKKWNNYNNYVDNAKTLGKLMLMARRLCEAGCGFVTVTTNFVWDMHSDKNNAGVEEGMGYMGRPFDHAVSTFIEDLEARGLSDKILLVCCGEMGRTPKIDNKGGRGHWGNLSPLMLSGGGLNMGQVIGQSTRDAGEPASEPITNRHLISTIMHTLLDVGRVRLVQGLPLDAQRAITDGEPIPGLM
ncbi:MAG: hypothetical protein COA78_33875 [Blastopirellula sp.]|nr:MAG: hypothetical protein COA78_33875 [Blastopirellula sp.]